MPKKPTVKVKVKLLTTVAKSIYSDTLMKIREAVTNSIDNKASRFLFTFKKNKAKNIHILSLFDNGHGITDTRFEEILQSIGYGLHLDEPHPEKYYSYFGLGLMSIFQLGNKITIITKPKNKKTLNKLEIDSGKIFSKEIEKESIEALSDCFELDPASKTERSKLSPLSDTTINKLFKGKPKHFTEIIIEDINEDDFEAIQSDRENFIENLSKMLPLPPDEKHPFLTSLKQTDKNEIIKMLKNRKYCPTISFSYSIGIMKHMQLYKYFPFFKNPLKKNRYQFYSENKNSFAYYLFASGKDLGVQKNKDRETGLWFRNKNILVKAADYLPHPGLDPLVDQPIQNWMYGEFFHENMNEFLQVSRNDFLRSKEFRNFREQVKDIVKPVSNRLRGSYDIGLKIINAIKEPIDKLTTEDSPFRKIEESIRRVEQIEEVPEEKEQEIENILSKIHSPELENSPDIINSLRKVVTITDEEKGYILKIDPSVTDDSIRYLVNKEITEVVIPSNIFERKHITFFGKSYEVQFKNGIDINSGISFNFAKRTIAVNPFYPDLKRHSVSFLEVDVALNYSYYKSNCTDEIALDCMDSMKKAAVEFLSGGYPDISEYIEPLEAIL